MKDIMSIMKQFGELQAKMEQMQEDLSSMEAQGQAGGGMVTVTLTGQGELKSLSIDPSLMRPGEEGMIEDLVVAAHAVARTKAEEMTSERKRQMMGGLPVPPGFKLPF